MASSQERVEWTDNYILLLLKLATAVKATKMMVVDVVDVVDEEFMQLAYFWERWC